MPFVCAQTDNGDREDARNLVVLITDGVANEREGDTLTEATLLKDTGAYIVSVGITDAIDEEQLKLISSNDHVYAVGDFAELGTIILDIETASCAIPPIGK